MSSPSMFLVGEWFWPIPTFRRPARHEDQQNGTFREKQGVDGAIRSRTCLNSKKIPLNRKTESQTIVYFYWDSKSTKVKLPLQKVMQFSMPTEIMSSRPIRWSISWNLWMCTMSLDVVTILFMCMVGISHAMSHTRRSSMVASMAGLGLSSSSAVHQHWPTGLTMGSGFSQKREGRQRQTFLSISAKKTEALNPEISRNLPKSPEISRNLPKSRKTSLQKKWKLVRKMVTKRPQVHLPIGQAWHQGVVLAGTASVWRDGSLSRGPRGPWKGALERLRATGSAECLINMNQWYITYMVHICKC